MSAPFKTYSPTPIIDVRFDIRYASPEMQQALSQAVKNGSLTLDVLRSLLDLNGASPVFFDTMTLYTKPDGTDVSFGAHIRKEF